MIKIVAKMLQTTLKQLFSDFIADKTAPVVSPAAATDAQAILNLNISATDTANALIGKDANKDGTISIN